MGNGTALAPARDDGWLVKATSHSLAPSLITPMTPERWQQVKAVLASALEQPDEKSRAAFLCQACDGDVKLESEVRSLLAQPLDQFEAVASTIGLVNPEPFAPRNDGRRLGAYELVRELGRGGMGTVWLARRADKHFEKMVAIKLLKRGTDTDEVLSRLHAERRILARLDHPNIARLLDAGTTEYDLPYFVMEYVQGSRLTDFAREKKLSFTEKLRLFFKICHAVQFAHQNLVVHRDLKPGNILVTAAGEPKLLDFGVAKLLAPDEDSGQMTIAGQERFTPDYASPEQVRGEAITTVSDVYSLGAILYQLLTGVTPHRFPTATPTATQIAQVICEVEASRPSAAAIDPQARLQLRGDLDNILMRALAKIPERRYRGAGHLADDIRRHLEDRPVRARPDTFGYRAGKFLRRNKKAAIAGALLVLSLLGGVIATAWEAHIANRERIRAERRFNEVRKIANSFLFDIHDRIAELPGALATRQLVTQKAVEYLDSLAEDAGNDVTLKSELSRAYSRIGHVTFDVHQAIATYQRAVSLNEALVAGAPENSTYRRQLSQSYDELSDVMKIAGHSAEAISLAGKALQTERGISGDGAGQHEEQGAIADCQTALVIALDDAGDFRSAAQNIQAVARIREHLLAQNPSDKITRRKLESAYILLSRTRSDAGDFSQAIALAEKAYKIARELFEADPSNSHNQRDMWATQFRFGRTLVADANAAGALEHFQVAVEFLEKLAVVDPNDIGHRRWLAVTYSAIGEAHAALGQREEALKFQTRAMALSETMASEDSNRAEVRRDLAQIHLAIGLLHFSNDDHGASKANFEQARVIAESLRQLDPANARVLSSLAEAYAGEGDCERLLAKKSGPAVREHLQAARQLYSRSIALWHGVKEKGLLINADTGKLDATTRSLAECDAALAADS